MKGGLETIKYSIDSFFKDFGKDTGFRKHSSTALEYNLFHSILLPDIRNEPSDQPDYEEIIEELKLSISKKIKNTFVGTDRLQRLQRFVWKLSDGN